MPRPLYCYVLKFLSHAPSPLCLSLCPSFDESERDEVKMTVRACTSDPVRACHVAYHVISITCKTNERCLQVWHQSQIIIQQSPMTILTMILAGIFSHKNEALFCYAQEWIYAIGLWGAAMLWCGLMGVTLV